MPRLQLRPTQNKWRQLKTQHIAYEDNQRQSGSERKLEPLHYDLMSSFLRNRPFSNPSQLVLEGASTSQQPDPIKMTSPDRFLTPHPILPPQPVVTLPQPVAAVPQPVIPPHQVILPQQSQPLHQIQPPHQVLPPNLAQAPDPVVLPHQDQGSEPAQANPTLIRTRRRMRPPTEKWLVFEVVKRIGERLETSLDRSDTYHDRKITLLNSENERQTENHAIDMEIRRQQLALLKERSSNQEDKQ